MSQYLDSQRFPLFLAKHFASNQSGRLVGPERSIDSGYFDIVRFFGDGALDPSTVRIHHHAERYQFTDPLIAGFAADMEKRLTSEGRLYDGPLTTRIVTADFSAGDIQVQPCRYADQAGTCFALDWPDDRFADSGGTLREYYRARISGSSYTDIPFPLCFGVCGFLVHEDQQKRRSLLLVRRSGKLASLEHSIGPSMAGAIDYEASDTTLLSMLTRSADQEIREELCLEKNEYDLIPLTYAREIFRGERPQLFCLIRTTLPQEEISKRLMSQKEKREFSAFAFVPLKSGRLPESEATTLNHEAAMSYWLTVEYLSAKN